MPRHIKSRYYTGQMVSIRKNKKNPFLRIVKALMPAVILLTLALLPAGGNPQSVDIITKNGNEYVSLYQVINSFDIDNSFDIITQRGRLYRKSSILVYQVGFSVGLINGTLLKSRYPVIREKGEIFLPLSFFLETASRFFQGIELARKGNSLTTDISAEPGPPRSEPLKKASNDAITFIVIDAGHGGKDPGAIGSGLREKDITLKVARIVAQSLKARLSDISVRLTRNRDLFIPLSSRTEFANKQLQQGSNGLFVSIHVNASISNRISGFETYFLSQNPSNDDARTTATLENTVVVMEHGDSRKKYNAVDYLEALMLTTQIQKESSMLAQSIQDQLDRSISEFKSRGVKKADFFVLRGALMPAALAEIGYISNGKEAAALRKQGYQKKIAEGISEGIVTFIKKYNSMIKN